MLFRSLQSLLATVLALFLVTAAHADDKIAIDANTQSALNMLRGHTSAADELLDKAVAVLVFPDVVKMGFGTGGQYGEGSLLVKGKPAAYYVTAGAPFGLPAGSQSKSQVILFMDQQSLQDFRNSPSWKVGIDGSVSLVQVGDAGNFDTSKSTGSMLGFIFSDQGLMHNLTLEGGKITRISR